MKLLLLFLFETLEPGKNIILHKFFRIFSVRFSFFFAYHSGFSSLFFYDGFTFFSVSFSFSVLCCVIVFNVFHHFANSHSGMFYGYVIHIGMYLSKVQKEKRKIVSLHIFCESCVLYIYRTTLCSYFISFYANIQIHNMKYLLLLFYLFLLLLIFCFSINCSGADALHLTLYMYTE